MAVDMEITVQLKRWIGQATAVAGNFAAPDGTIWRDSKPADRRLRTAQARVERPAQTVAVTEPAIPPRQRWASAVQGRSVDEATLRHDTHRIMVTGSVTWCDRCGAYAEIRGRGLARPCRGIVNGGTRVGRPLKDVQARLRALRAGKHPTTKIALNTRSQARAGACAPSSRDRERSRSARRAYACKSLIAAINGEVLPP